MGLGREMENGGWKCLATPNLILVSILKAVIPSEGFMIY
jgi:hypothetical protein